ncbi:peptidyl-prolyl cis-trans isomerase CYP26-2, chloroplastic-like [Telopea speciosissima]|uniref:peptidyl-prolyl cis-trans isomerase CYP26-2, chloroplastic-like n=1 Tax=Telopea speciosissima TaxID=54955 RepID=UPI001CC63827|nr:peptidyl-prolyl cis-trans isomerase CYP26-2, chloroplastic-like [Telopea speciosissima]
MVLDVELTKKTGSDLNSDNLLKEWEKKKEERPVTKNLANSRSIVARDPSEPQLKLIAHRGKLEIEQGIIGVDSDGTEFCDLLLETFRNLNASSQIEFYDLLLETFRNLHASSLLVDKRAIVAEML